MDDQPLRSLRHLSPAEKLFRLGIGLKLAIADTTDPETARQLQSFIEQLGL